MPRNTRGFFFTCFYSTNSSKRFGRHLWFALYGVKVQCDSRIKHTSFAPNIFHGKLSEHESLLFSKGDKLEIIAQNLLYFKPIVYILVESK